MTYAVSDIHGCYDKYIDLLRKISFGPHDTLYVLGDVIDRGPDGFKILLDMAQRSNVINLLGNHEVMGKDTAFCSARWKCGIVRRGCEGRRTLVL